MEYELVYDVSRHAYAGWGLPLGPLALSAAFFAGRRRLPTRNPLNHWRTLTALSATATLALGWFVLATNYRFRRALENGRARVVEGTVTDFRAGWPAGNGTERLTVRNDSQAVRFEYGPSVFTPGYTRLASRGGVLHEGAKVRVTFASGPTGPAIARIERARGAPDTAGRLTTR
jgi:hypothetical protein